MSIMIIVGLPVCASGPYQFPGGSHVRSSLWRSWEDIGNVAAHRGTGEVLCNEGDLLT